LASGVALSLHRAGFGVVMTEIARPTAIRLTVSFAKAVYDGSHTVEGVNARYVSENAWMEVVSAGHVAVLVDPHAKTLGNVSPCLLVDAIMAKRNTGTVRKEDSIVVGLGPGFTGQMDVDAVIETQRGHELGRIIYEGPAREDSGVPGEIGGRGAERVLRAPANGSVVNLKEIGSIVKKGEPVARIGEVAVTAPFDGCLRGLIHNGLIVPKGLKIADVDPRGETQYAFTVSDKARAVGRAVLEAALELGRERGLITLFFGPTKP